MMDQNLLGLSCQQVLAPWDEGSRTAVGSFGLSYETDSLPDQPVNTKMRIIKKSTVCTLTLKKDIEKITFKVVQMKFLAMHITNQKWSFDMFTVGNLQNIFIEHDLYLIS